MKYIEDFLERNKDKPFVTNLKRYTFLNKYGKRKCVSSFLTHLIIDSENDIVNDSYQEELLSILTNMILYNTDNFIDWLKEKV